MKNRANFTNIEGFDWDSGNIGKNLKHDIIDKETEEVFFNLPRVLLIDEKHFLVEKRFFILGITNKNRKLTISFTLRNKKFRIISARDMSKKERRFYEKKIQNNTTV